MKVRVRRWVGKMRRDRGVGEEGNVLVCNLSERMILPLNLKSLVCWAGNVVCSLKPCHIEPIKLRMAIFRSHIPSVSIFFIKALVPCPLKRLSSYKALLELRIGFVWYRWGESLYYKELIDRHQSHCSQTCTIMLALY